MIDSSEVASPSHELTAEGGERMDRGKRYSMGGRYPDKQWSDTTPTTFSYTGSLPLRLSLSPDFISCCYIKIPD